MSQPHAAAIGGAIGTVEMGTCAAGADDEEVEADVVTPQDDSDWC
jgi:hypothetical protein